MNKPLAAILFLSLAVSAGACEKSVDLGRMQEETLSVVKLRSADLDQLGRRAQAVIVRARALGPSLPGIAEASQLLGEAQAELAQLRGVAQGAQAALSNAAKSGQPDEVQKVSDEVDGRLDEGTATVRALLVGVENWVSVGENRPRTVTPPPPPVVHETPAEPAPELAFSAKLSTGFELHGASTGLEKSLVEFVADAARAVDKTTWFDFDRLTFQTSSAELDAAKSADQLGNIAEVLKAFPKVELKVGGYTDNTGDPAANQRLSQARAEHVVAALVTRGVEAKRLAAEGYGAEHPVCAANDTDECKAKNRRIAVRVTAK